MESRRARRFVTEVTRLYLLACVPLVVGLSVLSKLVVGIMAGADYAGGYRIMPYVLFGVLLLGIEQRYQSGLLFHKKTSFITVIDDHRRTAERVAQPSLHSRGTATSRPPSPRWHPMPCFCCLTAWFSRRVFVWDFPWRSLLNVAVASGVMAIVVLLVEQAIGLAAGRPC